jgi:hypothetical protein
MCLDGMKIHIVSSSFARKANDTSKEQERHEFIPAGYTATVERRTLPRFSRNPCRVTGPERAIVTCCCCIGALQQMCRRSIERDGAHDVVAQVVIFGRWDWDVGRLEEGWQPVRCGE